jgi:phospholipid/cholesterol/gamma-HCH transport system permease protein
LTGLGGELLASAQRFVRTLGATTRFLLHLLALTPAGFLRFRLIVEQVYNAGALSLVIIMTCGLFVGMVLVYRATTCCSASVEDSLGTARRSRCSGARSWSPRCCRGRAALRRPEIGLMRATDQLSRWRSWR